LSNPTTLDELARQLFARRRVDLPPKPPNADDDLCPKCGWAGDPGAPFGWRRTLYIPPLDAERNNVVQGECLMVSCERCGYRWHETVLNAESKPS
jgi:hypothetical protein